MHKRQNKNLNYDNFKEILGILSGRTPTKNHTKNT